MNHMPRDPDATRESLLSAAQKEFNSRGFLGTDTNRIARRAGFAPQTFYRHFEDKIAIFLAIYDGWWTAQSEALNAVLEAPQKGKALAAARIVLDFHVRFRVFRRSLRYLTVEEPRVRKARAAARKAQIARLAGGRPVAEMVAALLTAERLCDAYADEELADLGVNDKTAVTMVADVMRGLTG
jgi:AcrR family transcriptional regulator